MSRLPEMPDTLEIEIDNFVSPRAATDVPADDFVPLDMDPVVPAMLATVDAETPVVSTDVGSEPSEPTTDGNPLGVATTVVTSNAATPAFGSVRYDATPLTVPTGTIDANPTVVTHDGPDIFVARRLARGLSADAPMARPARVPTPADVAIPADDSVILPMVAAAIETDEKQCGIELAWNPATREGFEIPRATVCAILDSADLSAYHPPIPMPKGLFGVVFKQLNNAENREELDDDTRLLARCVTRNDYERLGEVWPDNLVSRYVVGTIDASLDLGSLGSKDLVCSLVTSEGGGFECQFSGGTVAMRAQITARFAALQGESLLNVTSLLKWYRDTLERKFFAIRDGFAMLIVDNGTKDAAERIATAEKLAQTLQGENPYDASRVMGRRLKIKRVVSRGGITQKEFYQAVGAGLLDAIREHGKVFAAEYALAQANACKAESARTDATPASVDLAVRRAMIGSDRANSKAIGLLATLKALQTRASAMVAVIGDHARPAIAACEALRMEYAPKCKGIDATAEMAANIELD